MKPYVYRQSRAGEKSRLYSGRYKDPKTGNTISRTLETADKQVAEKRLNDVISFA